VEDAAGVAAIVKNGTYCCPVDAGEIEALRKLVGPA